MSGTVLCIDPGSNLGYAILEEGELIEYGQLKTNQKLSQAERLYELRLKLQALVDDFKPNLIMIENVLTAAYQLKSKDAVLWLVGTYTMALLLSVQYEAEVVSVLPNLLKKEVTSKGNATKSLMIEAVNKRLKLNLKKSEHNKADALGLGIYYLDNIFKK